MKPGGTIENILFKYHHCYSASATFNLLILCAFNFLYRTKVIPAHLPQYPVPFAMQYPHFGNGKHDGVINIPLQHGDALFDPFPPQIESHLEILQFPVHVVKVGLVLPVFRA